MPTWLYWLHLKSRNQTDCKHDLQRSLQPFPFPVVGGISILMLRKLGFRKITQMTKVQWQPKTVPRTELRLEAQHKRGSDINLTNTSYYPENDSISALIKEQSFQNIQLYFIKSTASSKQQQIYHWEIVFYCVLWRDTERHIRDRT